MSKEDHSLVRIANKKNEMRAKAVASVAVCLAGVISMYITKGETGIGWAIFGLIIIWS